MNRSGYVKIMSALIRLMVTIMVEAGKVPIASAEKVGANVMKAITGGSEDNKK